MFLLQFSQCAHCAGTLLLQPAKKKHSDPGQIDSSFYGTVIALAGSLALMIDAERMWKGSSEPKINQIYIFVRDLTMTFPEYCSVF